MPLIVFQGELTAYENGQVVLDRQIDARWSTDAIKQEEVTLTAAATFYALTPPATAKAVFIDPGNFPGIVLKGVTGDTGVKLQPTTNPINCPSLITLGDTVVSIGLLNGATAGAKVKVIWL